MNPPDYDRAVGLLQAGQLVVFPTETVYGVGADAANPSAVSQIFTLKGRPPNHPLIVHIPSVEYLDEWSGAPIPPLAFDLANVFWPGPLTLILRRARDVPDAVTGGQETVGVRVPSHPVAQALLAAYAKAGGGRGGKVGIAAPSANRFGRTSPTRAEHVSDDFGDASPFILDGGACEVGIESTIIDLSRHTDAPRLLRPGGISQNEIEARIHRALTRANPADPNAPVRVSGSFASHYAPKTPMYLVPAEHLAEKIRACPGKKIGILLLSHSIIPGVDANRAIRLPDEPKGYAAGLYAALRTLDRGNHDLILAESVPDTPDWSAITDRLRRAAQAA